MNQDEIDIALDRIQEAQQDILIEEKLHSDLGYCMQYHGLDEIHEDIEKLIATVTKYGHQISIKDVISELKEI